MFLYGNLYDKFLEFKMHASTIVCIDEAFKSININEYIKDNLLLNGHTQPPDAIKIEFDLSKCKCELSLKSGFVLDLTNSNFGNLIGFDKKLYGNTIILENSTHWGTKTPNITNSIDTIYIHCDLISNSLVDGKYVDVIYTFSTANFERSYPFTIEPMSRIL